MEKYIGSSITDWKNKLFNTHFIQQFMLNVDWFPDDNVVFRKILTSIFEETAHNSSYPVDNNGNTIMHFLGFNKQLKVIDKIQFLNPNLHHTLQKNCVRVLEKNGGGQTALDLFIEQNIKENISKPVEFKKVTMQIFLTTLYDVEQYCISNGSGHPFGFKSMPSKHQELFVDFLERNSLYFMECFTPPILNWQNHTALLWMKELYEREKLLKVGYEQDKKFKNFKNKIL